MEKTLKSSVDLSRTKDAFVVDGGAVMLRDFGGAHIRTVVMESAEVDAFVAWWVSSRAQP